MDEPLGFVYLRDQEPLSDREYQTCLEICACLKRIIERRPDYIREHKLDPAVYFPAANWALDSGVHAGSRQVLSGNREVIQSMRLFSQTFTGFSLIAMKIAQGVKIPTEIPANLDDSLALIAAEPDLWVKRYLETVRKLPEGLTISPPRKFGEVGWDHDGKIINHDTYVYLERLALLYESGLLNPDHPRSIAQKQPLRILEIGGGYGGLAYYLRSLLPQARYTIVDLPESLIFSSIYLSTLCPDGVNALVEPGDPQEILTSTDPGFTLLPNYMFPDLVKSGAQFDLAINTLSMSEMSEAQVREYLKGIKKMLTPKGAFFEQNQDNTHVKLLNASDYMADYFPSRRTLTGSAIFGGVTEGVPHLWLNYSTLPEIKKG